MPFGASTSGSKLISDKPLEGTEPGCQSRQFSAPSGRCKKEDGEKQPVVDAALVQDSGH